MTIQETHSNLPKTVNGRTAVIVETTLRNGNVTKGVQYWSDEMINNGVSANTDNTQSRFIQKL